jgi:hypothetical protein
MSFFHLCRAEKYAGWLRSTRAALARTSRRNHRPATLPVATRISQPAGVFFSATLGEKRHWGPRDSSYSTTHPGAEPFPPLTPHPTMTDATDSLRPTKWRALVADLHGLIAERVSCSDESPPISSQLSALLATADFAALFTLRLRVALAHLLGWDDDIDAAPLRDQFLVAMGHCNSL